MKRLHRFLEERRALRALRAREGDPWTYVRAMDGKRWEADSLAVALAYASIRTEPGYTIVPVDPRCFRIEGRSGYLLGWIVPTERRA